jgi:DNA modification methylase
MNDIKIKKSILKIDGQLDQVDFPGDTYFRFPRELAQIIIERFSNPGDFVLDPFAGLGTTLMVAEELGRMPTGFEIEKSRAEFIEKHLKANGKIINDSIKNIDKYELPQFDLVFTSPQYLEAKDSGTPKESEYYIDLINTFKLISKHLEQDAKIVVEVSDIVENGMTLPFVKKVSEALSKLFKLEEDITRLNTADFNAGPGVRESHLFVFKK